jgi:ribonuclease E
VTNDESQATDSGTDAVTEATAHQAAPEQPSEAAPPSDAPAPRRRATRARTKKTAAAATTPAEAGVTPDGTDGSTTGSQASPDAAAAGTDTRFGEVAPAEPAVPAKRTRATRKRTTSRAAARTDEPLVPTDGETPAGAGTPAAPTEPAAALVAPAAAEAEVAEAPPAKKTARRRSRKAAAPVAEPAGSAESAESAPPAAPAEVEPVAEAPVSPIATSGAPADLEQATPAAAELESEPEEALAAPAPVGFMPLFQAPEPVSRRPRRAASRPAGPPVARPATVEGGEGAESADEDEEGAAAVVEARDTRAELAGSVIDEDIDVEETDEAEIGPEAADESDEADIEAAEDSDETDETDEIEDGEQGAPSRRRRRRGGRGRRGRGRTDADADEESEESEEEEPAAEGDTEAVAASDAEEGDDAEDSGGGSSRRRRRRRRRGSGGPEDGSPDDPPNTVVKVRESRRDDVTAIKGSTRLEAKKQRRREGREAGKRRSILTEAEFLTRRESVERVMVVREREGRTQIGVLEDNVLVEHYVARKTQTSTVGNVYLGRVQNVLPSMEAAFVDIGKGRNAVLYAGEVNWDAVNLDGQPRRIEHALKAGESVLVQVTKDPIGHKGARLTSQISMPGRYLVYVPDGSMTGISRKLPDTERSRLKKILREIVPDDAGVIVRTAAEGASDEELERDVARLKAQWDDISAKIKTVQSPALLYGEPDLAIRVVRDIFNEDFSKLIVSGDDAWDTLQGYLTHVAPDLAPRLERWTGGKDVFASHRIDEQLAKAMDRKVFLPSGGSLVIDRTEAMTVIDVNTGKFTGSGGNLESTVTENNLEAAEEVVRQLRLRDIGGIIVVDFIDMVLESNRDLVLRRLLECLGRDRTRHQVAEVTSLGLVQMTRKRVGQGLIEVFSETCEHCGGRGILVHDEPVEKRQPEMSGNSGNSGGGGGGGGGRRSRGNH